MGACNINIVLPTNAMRYEDFKVLFLSFTQIPKFNI